MSTRTRIPSKISGEVVQVSGQHVFLTAGSLSGAKDILLPYWIEWGPEMLLLQVLSLVF